MARVIAIDGPSGAGKSTVSRRLAEILGFHYLDSGALYRTAALYLRRKGLGEDSTDDEIKRALEGLSITFRNERVFIKSDAAGNESQTSGPQDRGDQGVDVSDAIRTTEIGHFASVFSARKVVRDFLLGIQRNMAIGKDLIAEGRDMTTVVFPDSWKKFFITASENERAKRRFEQLRDMGIDISMEEAIRDVRERDKRDQERDIAPLVVSKDAIIIDTSNKRIEDVIGEILNLIEKD